MCDDFADKYVKAFKLRTRPLLYNCFPVSFMLENEYSYRKLYAI